MTQRYRTAAWVLARALLVTFGATGCSGAPCNTNAHTFPTVQVAIADSFPAHADTRAQVCIDKGCEAARRDGVVTVQAPSMSAESANVTVSLIDQGRTWSHESINVTLHSRTTGSSAACGTSQESRTATISVLSSGALKEGPTN
jgi:hypothetical protein